MFVPLLFYHALKPLTNFLSQDDFFVGIGDINSAFLPKVELLAPAVPSPSLGESFFRQDLHKFVLTGPASQAALTSCF